MLFRLRLKYFPGFKLLEWSRDFLNEAEQNSYLYEDLWYQNYNCKVSLPYGIKNRDIHSQSTKQFLKKCCFRFDMELKIFADVQSSMMDFPDMFRIVCKYSVSTDKQRGLISLEKEIA